MSEPGEERTEAFIATGTGVTASELSTSQSFLVDLCALLGVDTPQPTAKQDYMFELALRGGGGRRQPNRAVYRVQPLGRHIAARFASRGPWKKRLPGLLEMLVTPGRASMQGDRYTGTN